MKYQFYAYSQINISQEKQNCRGLYVNTDSKYTCDMEG